MPKKAPKPPAPPKVPRRQVTAPETRKARRAQEGVIIQPSDNGLGPDVREGGS